MYRLAPLADSSGSPSVAVRFLANVFVVIGVCSWLYFAYLAFAGFVTLLFGGGSPGA